MAKSRQSGLHQRRNPVAQAAILRKGGAHEKSRKAKRLQSKRELRNAVTKAMATHRGHWSFWGLWFALCFTGRD